MRAALLYKYGGFYLDTDVLTLKDLTRIRNSLVIDYRYSDYRHGLQWTDLGPPLVHKAANQYLGRDSGLDSEPVNTPDLTILPSFAFRIYLPDPPCPKLTGDNVSTSEYEDFMRCSYVLHLGGQMKNSIPDGNPRHDIYSYIGPKICPISFSYLNLF
ncbi:lactosylceramide 4-alpha-galactosyltransferase-like [Convolutriloba macropyga]|uniref:lactosylceramide 4-alpha-galactosyltransferase-like n=1 Tax=Convolutriloba macropyga TaxID=536237 RepID=UPI003F522F4D